MAADAAARRLFAALAVPPAAREHLARALPRSLNALPTERWHVTVAFYGAVARPGVPELTDRLTRSAARGQVLRLALGGGGVFGRSGVLWCGLHGDLESLSRLAAAAAAAGRRMGIPVERRPYRAHLTVARLRGADPQPALAALEAYLGPQWTASELMLVESILPPPPRYQPVASFPLGRRPGSAADPVPSS
jgi:2'-5' RNA ligase